MLRLSRPSTPNCRKINTTIRLTTFVGLIFISRLSQLLKKFFSKTFTTFTTFGNSCEIHASRMSGLIKKMNICIKNRVKMKITPRKWKTPGFLIPAAYVISLYGLMWGCCWPSAGRSGVPWCVYIPPEKRPAYGR